MIEITAELQNGSRKSSTVEEACAVSLRCFYTTGDSRKCGFDWFRIGDNGDIPFKECVGYYWDKGHKISDPYIYDKALFKPDKDLQNTLQGNYKVLKDVFWRNGYKGEKMPYIVPILSIGEGEHISLDIKRDGKQSSDIFVESDLEDSSVYDYPKTIAPNQDSFAITCLKMQDKISLLKFFSDESKEEQCGELVIIPKSLVFCKNVEIVFCKVYIVDSGRNLNTVFGNYRLQLLNKNSLTSLVDCFSQALVDIQYNKTSCLELEVWEDDMQPFYVKLKDKNAFDIEKSNELIALLRKREKEKYFSVKKDCIKVYIMPDIPFINKYGKETRAFSVIGQNTIFCKNGVDGMTLVHEVGHALGLPHTFVYRSVLANSLNNKSNNSEMSFCYEKKKTDNFMDYSNYRMFFYYWQWKVMNEKLINIKF